MKKLVVSCLGLVLLFAANNASAQDLLAFNDVSTQVGFSEQNTLPSSNADLRRGYGRRRSSDSRFAVGLQVPYNFNKLGVGINFTYQFTDILRFYVGMDHFFYAQPNRRFNTITETGKKGEDFWGSHWDVNPNLNFVFGDGDFHFVLIGGLYFSYGYTILQEALTYDNDEYQTINGVGYYKTDKMEHAFGVGFNLGCGIEYQINDQIRLSFDQQLGLGIMIHWMTHLGVAYCF